jgi:hypothetical protein
VNRLLSNGTNVNVNYKDNVCDIYYIIMWCAVYLS